MVSQNSSAALQRQMQDIRRNLNECTDEVVKKARTQFDWRHYVASHPWLSVGAAVTAGYFLVPRRTCGKGADSAAITEAVDRVERAAQARPPSPLSGVASGVLNAVTATIVLDGMAFLRRCARQWLEAHDASSKNGPAGESDLDHPSSMR